MRFGGEPKRGGGMEWGLGGGQACLDRAHVGLSGFGSLTNLKHAGVGDPERMSDISQVVQV